MTAGNVVRVVSTVVVTLVLATGSGVTAAASDCFSDPRHDTFRHVGGEVLAENHATGDLVEYCANLTATTLVLTLQTAVATDPLQDAAWGSADTLARWELGVEPEPTESAFTVAVRREAGRLQAAVTEDGQPRCTADAGFDGGKLTVSIPAGCVDGPARVHVWTTLRYDAEPDDARSGVIVDDTLQSFRQFARVSGSTPFATSAAIAGFGFTSADSVYLARGDAFADAVAAGPLRGGPVLLVPPCPEQVPRYVTEHVQRLDPDRVVALGGQAAVCEELLREAAGERLAVRLAGPTRVHTAVAIAQEAFPDGTEEVFLAGATSFADAVAGGTLTGGPILLVPRDGPVPQVVHDEIARLGARRVVALGGPAALSDATLAEAAGTLESERVSGSTRIATAAAISARQFPQRATEVYLTGFDRYAEAVSGGALPHGPVLLVPPSGPLPDAVRAEIARLYPRRVVALGDEAAVSEEMLREAARVGLEP